MKNIEFDTKSGGVSFTLFCTLVLVILKAFGLFNCGWWIVFVPILVDFVIYFFCIFLVGLIVLLYMFNNSGDSEES